MMGGTSILKKILFLIAGLLIGAKIGFFAARCGIGNNSGSEFWGDKFADVLQRSGRGLGNNSGSKFYSDLYIKERFRDEPADTQMFFDEY